MIQLPEWTTASPDWQERIVKRLSLIPCAPLFPSQADLALAIFKELKVVDMHGQPTFGQVAEQWVFDLVSAIFGAYDPITRRRLINKFFWLISKKNTKSTTGAGIMLTATLLNERIAGEFTILAPTKEVAGNSFVPARGMVKQDAELEALFHVQDHTKTITHRLTEASLKVVAAESDSVGGKKTIGTLVDELYLFGRRADAESMFTEALGGMVSNPEAFVIYATTHDDRPPAGVYDKELKYARKVREGEIVDKSYMPIIYEYPEEYIEHERYKDPETWYITNPNLGASVSKEALMSIYQKAQDEESLRFFFSKHLNVEIGLSLRSNRWAGADFWEAKGGKQVTFDYLLEHAEVITGGIDGGGLDDLLALCLIGREKGTGKWLHWVHAWAHEIVLERRKDIVTQLKQFEAEGDLTIVKVPGYDIEELADILCLVKEAWLFPEKNAIGVDPAGINDVIDELTNEVRGFTQEQIVGISQGYRLNAAIKSTERKVAGDDFVHGAQPIMSWAVSNARIEQKGNAILVTKQASGSAKIDPLMATFSAVSLMGLNPASQTSVYEQRGIRVIHGR